MFLKTTILLSLTILLVLNSVDGGPLVINSVSDPVNVLCYSLECPAATKICRKSSEISEVDRSKLVVLIQCYDVNGNVLKSRNVIEDNPFGPNVYYKGSTFSAVIRISPSHNNNNPEEPTDVKEFNIGTGYSGVDDNGPKSEVEDLNG